MPLEGDDAKYNFQRLFDCHLILIHYLSSKNLNVTFLHKKVAQISILVLGYPQSALPSPHKCGVSHP
jgi:hypothetical protein